MKWHKLEGEFWRSANGRFDLLLNVAGVWVVYDGDTGTRVEFGTREDAEAWAEQQQGGSK
jgi:hypothetical protein